MSKGDAVERTASAAAGAEAKSIGTADVRRAARKHIVQYFQQPIKPVRVSPLYLVGLFIVAFTMLLLPAVYLGLIGLTALAVYWHATHDATVLFTNSRGGFRASLIMTFIYVAPLVAGVTLVLFMSKPLFARRIKRSSPYSIEPGQEPLLYSFVDAIARTVGAPSPRIIEVNCQVNASASFRRGLLSIFTDDLRLTIGMPLIAGMTTCELAGVIAHELGHFSQRLAMRLSYIIHSINDWFARVVYERDSLDEQIVNLAQHESGWVMLTFQFVRLCIWLTRGVLYLLMMAAHGISCFMARQMEYDADLHEIRLAGSEAFERTSERMRDLAVAAQHLSESLPEQSKAGRLGDDFPALIVSAAKRIPRDVRKLMQATDAKERTRIFATHPPMRNRIDRARKAGETGVFSLEKPSRGLLKNFPVICKWVTVGYYKDVLRTEISLEQLEPTTKILKDHAIDESASKAFTRFFQGMVLPTRWLFLEKSDQPNDAGFQEQVQRLKQFRSRMQDILPAARKAVAQCKKAEQATQQQYEARLLMSAENLPPASDRCTGGPNSSIDWLHIERLLDFIDSLLRSRLQVALHLLNAPEIAQQVDKSGKLKVHSTHLRQCLAALESEHSTIQQLRRDVLAIFRIFQTMSKSNSETMASKAIRTAEGLHQKLTNLRSMLRTEPYPLEHSGAGLTVGAWAIETIPPAQHIGEVILQAQESGERLRTLYYRIMGRLAIIAEKVELAVGLPPLPEPETSGNGMTGTQDAE